MDALGIKYDGRFVVSEGQRNISLLGNAHEIKRVLNSLPDLSDRNNTFFRKIVVGMSEQRPDLKSETMFSAEEALEFMEKYREDNRKVMREYFGKDEDLFDMDFSKNKNGCLTIRRWKRISFYLWEMPLWSCGRKTGSLRRTWMSWKRNCQNRGRF